MYILYYPLSYKYLVLWSGSGVNSSVCRLSSTEPTLSADSLKEINAGGSPGARDKRLPEGHAFAAEQNESKQDIAHTATRIHTMGVVDTTL